jgi:putative acetyltransferase
LNFDFFFFGGTVLRPCRFRPKWNLHWDCQEFPLLSRHCKLNCSVMNTAGKVTLTEAQAPADIIAVRGLFIEYAAWIGFSLAYQNFDQELASLPGKYAGPTGRLFLACVDDAPAGCGAIRQIEPSVCEMKRLFVRREFRGFGIGRKLAETLIGEARKMGYSAMRLDTVAEKMGDAVQLYRALGFREIPAYYSGARAGTLYFELRLT